MLLLAGDRRKEPWAKECRECCSGSWKGQETDSTPDLAQEDGLRQHFGFDLLEPVFVVVFFLLLASRTVREYTCFYLNHQMCVVLNPQSVGASIVTHHKKLTQQGSWAGDQNYS